MIREEEIDCNINPWTLLFKDPNLERELELKNLRTRKSIVNAVIYFVILFYFLSMYWANVLLEIPNKDPILPLFFLCIVTYTISTGLSMFMLFGFDEETVVCSSLCRWLFAVSAWSMLFNFGVLFYIQGHYSLCHPTHLFNNICSHREYPTDILFCVLCTCTISYLGFPSFSWGYALITHLAAIIISCVCTPLFHSSLKVPLLAWSSVCITVGMFVKRRDSIRHFLQAKNSETKKELEQHAKLGDRLRLMISGVAHDLKSPLSALSLGLESISVIHDAIHSIVYDVPSKAEQMSRTEDLLSTIKDLGQWLDNSRRAMTTIISRLVDVNQALNGVPLVPMLRDIEVVHVVESVVKHYSDDNQHVQLIAQIDNSVLHTNRGHLQTDALWFRESLGCLLSNAIKFCDYSDALHLHEGHKQHVQILVTRVVEDSNSLTMSEWGNRLSRTNSSINKNYNNNRSNAYAVSKDANGSVNLEDCFLRIEVWDEGVGVEQEVAKTLFSFLGHGNQVRVGGAGLGLGALACRIRTLGGRYGYEPRMNRDYRRGSIFWFEVPYKPLVFSRSGVVEEQEVKDSNDVENPSNEQAQSNNENPVQGNSSGNNNNDANVPGVEVPTVTAATNNPGAALLSSLARSFSNMALSTSSKESLRSHSSKPHKRGVLPELMQSPSILGLGRMSRSNSSNVMQTHASHPAQQPSLIASPDSAMMVRMDSAVDRLTEEVRLQLLGEESATALNVKSSKFQHHSSHHHHRRFGPNHPVNSTTLTISSTGSKTKNSPKPGLTPISTDSSEHQQLLPVNKPTQQGIPSKAYSTGLLSGMLSGTSRVIPVDDDYAPYETKLERRGSHGSLVSIKEGTSEKQSSHSNGTYSNKKSSPGDSSHYIGSHSTGKIVSNMPMVAESSPDMNDCGSCASPLNHHADVLSAMIQSPEVTSPLKPQILLPVFPIATSTSINSAANSIVVSQNLVAPSFATFETGSVNGASHALPPKHVLIVDDSMPIRKMCSMILKQHGHTVMTAMNGKEALQMMVQAFDARLATVTDTMDKEKMSSGGKVPEIDLVLMDIQMPVMDGIEAVTLYRAHETDHLQKLSATELSRLSQPQRLLIIGMSACSDIEIIEKGLSVGMDRFVAKPFQIQHLTPIISEYFHPN